MAPKVEKRHRYRAVALLEHGATPPISLVYWAETGKGKWRQSELADIARALFEAERFGARQERERAKARRKAGPP